MRHYAYQTEVKYLHWMRQFIRFHGKRHPVTLSTNAVSDFLSHLAVNRYVSPSTQNQALNALVFLYREVLEIDTKELPGFQWATKREHIPTVFSRDEVAKVLQHLTDQKRLMAALMYG